MRLARRILMSMSRGLIAPSFPLSTKRMGTRFRDISLSPNCANLGSEPRSAALTVGRRLGAMRHALVFAKRMPRDVVARQKKQRPPSLSNLQTTRGGRAPQERTPASPSSLAATKGG